jgi:hypothetical protein
LVGAWGIPTRQASTSAIFDFKNKAGVIVPVFIEFIGIDRFQ